MKNEYIIIIEDIFTMGPHDQTKYQADEYFGMGLDQQVQKDRNLQHID